MESTGKCCGYDDVGKLILRLTTGGLMLFHGVGKIRGGVDMIAKLVTDNGLPSFVAYGVYVGEVLAPVLLILGFFTRTAALILAINMVFAVGLAHAKQLMSINQFGVWDLELHGFYFFNALAIMFLGSGRLSIDHCAWKKCETKPPAASSSNNPPA